MPGGTAELPILFRGSSTTADSTSAAATGNSHGNSTAGVGEVFHSILRFLHLDSGLPSSPSSYPAPPSSRISSNAETEVMSPAEPPVGASARSFRSNSNMSTSSHEHVARDEAQASATTTTTTSTSSAAGHDLEGRTRRKKNPTAISDIFTSLFKKRRNRSRSPMSRNVSGGKGDKPHFVDPAFSNQAQADDFRAASVLIDIDEDEDRVDLIRLEESIFAILLQDFYAEHNVLRERTEWSGDGREVSDAQMQTIYFMFFRQMKSLLAQQFSQIFPRGIHGTSLSAPDVAACVAALILIEMAITDDDIHSFAFSIYPGRRISLENCPPSKRYLYFLFMAFKSTVPSFRSQMDSFRTVVVRYFYDRNSMKKAGSQRFEFPLQALLHALAPVLFSPHFQKMTASFYYYAINLEKERLGESDEEALEETPLAQPSHSVQFTEGATSNDNSEQPSSSSGIGKRARRTSGGASGNTQCWSTVAFSYRKATGDVIGQGAYGTVYRCYDASNGAFYAMKELSLLTAGMKRRIRAQSDRNAANEPIKLSQMLTEQERNEIRSREKAICGEINMLKSLRHPCIVSYYGCTFDRRSLKVSILMEYCPKTLRAIIDDVGALPLPMIAHYATQILNGISFLHDHHVVHRDIKAANILVKDSGEAKVSDFGTAMLNSMGTPTSAVDDGSAVPRQESDTADELSTLFATSRSHRSTDSNTSPKKPPSGGSQSAQYFNIQGTPLFLAPEVANGCLPSEASDIWSFGCLLIEMASGLYPWHEWTNGEENMPLEMIVFHIASAAEPPKLLPEYAASSATCETFLDFLRACLQLDPVARPSAKALLQHAFIKEQVELAGVGSERPAMDDDEEDDSARSVLNNNLMSIVPNDSLAEPSGCY